MSERRDITTDDVIRRLQQLPGDAWEPPQAPPLRIDFGADTAPARRPAQEREPGRLRAWLTQTFTMRPLSAAALASVFLFVGVAGGVVLSGGSSTTGQPAEEVQLAALPGAPGVATATAAMGGDLDGMELKVSGLSPSKPGEYYELWALNSPDDLAPIGTFRVGEDGSADVRFALGIDPSRYRALDVSVEREDGDPGHSGKSVLRAPVAAA
jgi:hypothetical protein